MKNKRLSKEAKNFNRIYNSRFRNMRNILLDDDRVEGYFFKNPWRFGFSRRYAFNHIIEQFNELIGKKNCRDILEIGCGNGWFSINANLDNRNNWDCFDLSGKAINAARYYAAKNGVKNRYEVSSAEDFKSGKKYDVVVCVNALHHIVDLNTFKKNVDSYLKDKGSIFIYDVCPDRFSIYNAAHVLIIESLLGEFGAYYMRYSPAFNLEKKLERILLEWKNETDNKKQSVNDHSHSTDFILNFLEKNFKRIHYSEYGGILMRLLGGIRVKHPKKITAMLIKAEEILLKKKIISPYCYCFIGRKMSKQGKVKSACSKK